MAFMPSSASHHLQIITRIQQQSETLSEELVVFGDHALFFFSMTIGLFARQALIPRQAIK
jgi:hypothetical protein